MYIHNLCHVCCSAWSQLITYARKINIILNLYRQFTSMRSVVDTWYIIILLVLDNTIYTIPSVNTHYIWNHLINMQIIIIMNIVILLGPRIFYGQIMRRETTRNHREEAIQAYSHYKRIRPSTLTLFNQIITIDRCFAVTRQLLWRIITKNTIQM